MATNLDNIKQIHQNLLDSIYANFGNLVNSACTIVGVPIDQLRNDYCCPVIVGGYAYWKHCKNYNESVARAQQQAQQQGQQQAQQQPQQTINALKTDDIDIKLAIKATAEELNNILGSYKRLIIKSFRLILMTQIYAHAHSFLSTKNQGFKIEFRFQTIYDLLQGCLNQIRPLELACLTVEYTDSTSTRPATTYNFGLIDTSFILREDSSSQPAYLTIKQFYAALKMTQSQSSQQSINQNVPGPEPTTNCEIIPRDQQSFLASLDFMMLDTVRMLSKISTYGDVCTARPAQQPDVYKFKKYVVKFIHLAKILRPSNNYMSMYTEYTDNIQDQKNLYVKWTTNTDGSNLPIKTTLEEYLQFLPIAEPMCIGGRKGKRTKMGGTRGCTPCPYLATNDEFIYNEYEEIIIQDRVIDKESIPIDYSPFEETSKKSTGGSRKRRQK